MVDTARTLISLMDGYLLAEQSATIASLR